MKKGMLLLFLTISAFCSAQNETVVRNLVFEGGGVRGLAYAGALMEMQDQKMLDQVQRVGGTSAGAIAATLYAVGYTPEEILTLISDLNVKSFADGRWIFIGGTRRMIRNFGWYRGDKFHKWIGRLIKAKTGKETLTFQELYDLAQKNAAYKVLYLTGTNLTMQRTDILCHETFPAMEVRTAVRISMSIPFFFQAVVIDKEGKVCARREYNKGNVMVDGGITANFPIHIFDYTKYLTNSGDSTAVVNYETIGLRLDSDEQIQQDRNGGGLAPVEIQKIKDFGVAFYRVVLESLNRHDLTKDDWERTISISTAGISPRIKRLPQAQKDLLVENGRKGVREFLSKK